MHAYCTDVLHLSEAEAFFRITAARASRRYPVLVQMLDDGRLHLSGLAVLAPHLDSLDLGERDELLARAAHKTKREIKELVAEVAPKPDVAPRVRKVPERRIQKTHPPTEQVEARASTEQTTRSGPSETARSSTEPAGELAAKGRDEREQVEPLSPARYKVQFTATAELRDKLERLAALIPGEALASVIDAAVSEKLERLEAKRFGKVKRPRKNVEDADAAPGVRGISAPVRRFVWERDGRRCTFRAADGRRCPERHRLEFHHDAPYGLGGDRSPSNVRLLCRAHNLYMAEQDYGKELMDAYRSPSDSVREPQASFELGLDRAQRASSQLVAG